MRTSKVRVDCLDGLPLGDEFYVWGLLALTFGQSSPSFDSQATPRDDQGSGRRPGEDGPRRRRKPTPSAGQT